MVKSTNNESVCVINVDNDESGVRFVFQENKDAKPQSFDVDEGAEAGSLQVTPEFEGEFSVVFPADAWITVVDGQPVVKFCNYGDDAPSFTVLPYDKS